MKLTGFEFITGKFVPRPWGTEYRFTAAGAGTEYNEVLDVKKDIDEKALAVLVQERLDRVSVPVEPVVETVTVEQVAGTGYGRIQFEASGPYIVAWRTASAQNGPIVTMSTFTQATGTEWQTVQCTRTDATAIDIIVDYRVIAV